MCHIRRGDGHGCAKFIGFRKDIGIKERFADNAHGEIGHLLVDVNGGAIRPGLLDVLAVMPHDFSIAGNMTWWKDGAMSLRW